MKLVFPLGCYFPSQIGGPCNTLHWHTCELNKHEIDTCIITTTVGIPEGDVEVDTVLNSDYRHVYYGNGGSKNLRTIRQSFKSIKNAEVVHLNSLFEMLSIVSFFYIQFFQRKKVVWSVRGELNENALRIGAVKKRGLLFLYRLFNRKVYFHSTSDKETLEIKAVFPKSQVFQIPNLIYPAERLQIPKKNQLLFVGRIHPIKGIHKLIEAIGLSDAFRKSDFKLIIAGESEDRYNYYLEELKNLIVTCKLEEKIEFVGHVIGEKKEVLYAESRFTILPSETENFGNVVVESLNQQTPVLASSGTPWGILESKNCGFHVSNEPAVLSEYIDKIIGMNNVEFEIMGTNALRLVDNEFHVQHKIMDWIKIYKSVYENKR